MPDDEFNKRMNYFDRQFLRAADFQVEQKYHLDRHRRHNRLLHTDGLGGPDDLRVTGIKGQSEVTVSSGTAIDQQGREIVLSASEPPLPLTQLPEAGKYAIYVELIEKLTDPSMDPGVEGPTRTTEIPTFRFQKLVTNRPDYPPLTLAVLTVDANKKLTEDADLSMRKLAATRAGFTGTFDTVTAGSLMLTKDGGAIDSPMWKVRLSFNERSKKVEPNQPLFTPEKQFPTAGGTLLIFASISVLPKPDTGIDVGNPFIIGINILLDGNKLPNSTNPAPSVPGCAQKTQFPGTTTLVIPHTTVATTLSIPNIAKGSEHKLTLQAAANTTLTDHDFYSVTILELPF